MIIWLASYPRSGNSFVRLWLRTAYQAQSGSVYGSSETRNMESVRDFLGESATAELDRADAAPEPYFVKTHELPSDDRPAIYVVRDGRDALVSYAHFIIAQERTGQTEASDSLADVLEQLVLSDEHFGGWSRHVRAWTERAAPTAIVRYEDVHQYGQTVLDRAIGQLGLSLTPDTESVIPDFGELHTQFPWFFRKGRIGAWREEMSASLEAQFWDRHGAMMQQLGYLRDDGRSAHLDHFFSPHYSRYNAARLEHLAHLGLPLYGRRVLELGAGPGRMTPFFLDRGCQVVATDVRPECVLMLKALFPEVTVACRDMNRSEPLADLGRFDVVHCYGLLYHLEQPARAIAAMAHACSDLLLVETCVSPGDERACPIVRENVGDYTQSGTGFGCRPTRAWVFDELRAHFPFVYVPKTQPAFMEFPLDWTALADTDTLIREIFVASRSELRLPSLEDRLSDRQTIQTHA